MKKSLSREFRKKLEKISWENFFLVGDFEVKTCTSENPVNSRQPNVGKENVVANKLFSGKLVRKYVDRDKKNLLLYCFRLSPPSLLFLLSKSFIKPFHVSFRLNTDKSSNREVLTNGCLQEIFPA